MSLSSPASATCNHVWQQVGYHTPHASFSRSEPVLAVLSKTLVIFCIFHDDTFPVSAIKLAEGFVQDFRLPQE